MAMAAQIFGRNVTVLKNAFPLSRSEFNRLAMSTDNTSMNRRPVIQYSTVFPRASQNILSISSFLIIAKPAKLRRPDPLPAGKADVKGPDGGDQLEYKKQQKKRQYEQIGSFIFIQCLQHMISPHIFIPSLIAGVNTRGRQFLPLIKFPAT
jgi:hypothetical protein